MNHIKNVKHHLLLRNSDFSRLKGKLSSGFRTSLQQYIYYPQALKYLLRINSSTNHFFSFIYPPKKNLTRCKRWFPLESLFLILVNWKKNSLHCFFFSGNHQEVGWIHSDKLFIEVYKTMCSNELRTYNYIFLQLIVCLWLTIAGIKFNYHKHRNVSLSLRGFLRNPLIVKLWW